MEALYLVDCDYGKKLGSAIRETTTSPAEPFAMVVTDLADGQYTNPTRILEVIPSEGTCRDISEDVAKSLYYSGSSMSDDAWRFCARYISHLDADINETSDEYADDHPIRSDRDEHSIINHAQLGIGR